MLTVKIKALINLFCYLSTHLQHRKEPLDSGQPNNSELFVILKKFFNAMFNCKYLYFCIFSVFGRQLAAGADFTGHMYVRMT